MLRALPLVTLLALTACDTSPVTPQDTTPGEPVPVLRNALLPTDIAVAFGAQLSPRMGTILNLAPAAGEPADAEFKLWSTSLWLAGEQGGRTRYVGNTNAFRAGYAPCDDAGNTGAHFQLRSGVEYTLGEWPVALGAPLTADGDPRVYGDVMLWEAYCAQAMDVPGGNDWMLRDVQVNHAAFSHDAYDRVRFFRYEITNRSDAPITGLRAGFYSDPDVTQHYRGNLLGGTDRYAYSYLSPAYAGTFGGPTGAVAALGILEFPKQTGLAARRIEYRNGGPGATSSSDRVPYTEAGMGETHDAPPFAMRGLDDFGDAIVDPTTGAATTFMYSGNPIAGTGWLDGTLPGGANGWDIRVLQPTDAFSLAPGETVVLTAVAVYAVGADLASGLAAVDGTFSAVASDPSLWQFPIATQ